MSSSISSLKDDELFKAMKIEGLTCGPVTPTTRSIYEKRLIKHVSSLIVPGVKSEQAILADLLARVAASPSNTKSVRKKKTTKVVTINDDDDDDDNIEIIYDESDQMPPPRSENSKKLYPPLEFKLLTNDILNQDNTEDEGNDSYSASNDYVSPNDYGPKISSPKSNFNIAPSISTSSINRQQNFAQGLFRSSIESDQNDSLLGSSYLSSNMPSHSYSNYAERPYSAQSLKNRKPLIKLNPTAIFSDTPPAQPSANYYRDFNHPQSRFQENRAYNCDPHSIYNEPPPPQPKQLIRNTAANNESSVSWFNRGNNYIYILGLLMVIFFILYFLQSNNAENPISYV